jgi:hypothetical protein
VKTLPTTITRKEFIEECVKGYIRQNPREWELFKVQMNERRSRLFDHKFGQFKTKVNGREKVDEDNFRLTLSLPAKLMNALRVVIQAGDNEPLFEPKGEMTWFKRRFPEFMLTTKI